MRSIHRNDAARRTSDGEITRPHNDLPSEPPPLPAWHVHLELQPEELITLHRLGFTGGALAWREGMPAWQPLRVGEVGLREAQDSTAAPYSEESLPQPILLTRRSLRSGSGSVVALERVRPFSSGRHSTPPLAVAVAPKSDRPRPELILPPPPPIEGRVTPPELEPDAPALALAELRLEHSRSQMSALREQQQPPSIPPLALDARPRRPRSNGTRALWLGAAALVALSASNGALVSALLWSLRHDSARPAASAARTAGAGSARLTPASSGAVPGAECPAPSAGNGRAAPVSVDQLPLLGGEKTTGEHATSERAHARSALAPASAASTRSASSRKGPARAVGADEAASARRPEPPAAALATTPGALDRRALAQAVARAAGAASSCAPGPEKGRVALTFSPSGSVQAAQLEQPFGEPGINSCVLRAMGRARVRAFVGEAVTVHKTLSW